jgi:Domain of unknown function (DUF4287)
LPHRVLIGHAPGGRDGNGPGSSAEEDVVTFQAYLDNIKAKTGKTPADFKVLAEEDGIYAPDMKAGELVDWLNNRFHLGRGHSMAVWAVFKSKGWVNQGGA